MTPLPTTTSLGQQQEPIGQPVRTGHLTLLFCSAEGPPLLDLDFATVRLLVFRQGQLEDAVLEAG